MARAHDERRAGQAAGRGGDHGIAAAVGVEHIVAAALEQAAQAQHALDVVERAVHVERMHGKAGIPQAFAQLRIGLDDGLHVVAALAHGQHLLEDAALLAAETGGGLGVDNTQGPHQ